MTVLQIATTTATIVAVVVAEVEEIEITTNVVEELAIVHLLLRLRTVIIGGIIIIIRLRLEDLLRLILRLSVRGEMMEDMMVEEEAPVVVGDTALAIEGLVMITLGDMTVK